MASISRLWGVFNREFLYMQYGYSKYGGWGTQFTILAFSAMAGLRGFVPPTLAVLGVVMLAAGLIAAMIEVGRRSALTSGGITGMEHAMLTARNPVWGKYIELYALERLGADQATLRREASELLALLYEYADDDQREALAPLARKYAVNPPRSEGGSPHRGEWP